MLFKMDNNEVTGLVSVDSISVKLSTQSIMTFYVRNKLSVYGAIPDNAAWFWSYLEGRRQFVKLGI